MITSKYLTSTTRSLGLAAGSLALLLPTGVAMAAPAGATAPPAIAAACSIPATADDGVLKAMQLVLNAEGANAKVRLATFETAWVESHANNLNCGDRDSLGVFQQRPSQGWGTAEQIRNVTFATTSFVDRAIAENRNNPDLSAGRLAQKVQVSAYPDRYDQSASIATNLMQRAEKLAGGETPPATNPGGWPIVKTGATGSRVLAVQHLLTANGHKLSVDGKFGSGTATAVREFQKAKGLSADAVVGPDTWQALTSGKIQRGSTGARVQAAQTLLKASGQNVTVDGKFGPATTAAVKKFQVAKKLTADGVVGPNTWRALAAS